MQRTSRISESACNESEDIHIPVLDVGGGLIIGCRSHPQNAGRVEDLEEIAWSIV